MYESAKIADNIKSLARSKDIQLKIMLHELDLSKNALSTLYNGSMIKADSLARIADYLECSVDYLLGRTNNPDINNGNNITTGNINGNHNANISVGATLLSNDEEEILKMVRELSLIQRSELVITINKMKSDNKI